ncbi:low molecular weight phosphotyrosine protein phosphatase [Sulfurimonas sp. SAG-AH-194-C20]|nr:low molecular weight protein-tyrosine-phosphatase [Sulfurimonas sp. SAG-AH-194-C20]MDF1879058.1 low molecular weight phosphotyrosine protein phosphatase [Sulfurimonas sp. SAG-AH-194-C20]
MKSVIFVCLGNICRSPIAEGCAKRLVKESNLDILVSSAGTGSWHTGEAPCPNSIEVCNNHNVDISKLQASQFTKEDIGSYDLVVALDDSNYSDLKSMGDINLVKLGSYGYDSEDVPDPYYFNGFEGFERVYTMIDECVNNLFKNEVI